MDSKWFERIVATEAERRRRERISPLWWIAYVGAFCLFILGSSEAESIGQEYDLFYQACECQP
jgi:hypothetical protein